MEGSTSLDSEPCGGGGGHNAKKGNVVKVDSVEGVPKKILADITNLQQKQHQKPLSQQLKPQSTPLAADYSTDQLLQENAKLRKLLANRDEVLESCKAQLQKFQINFQKLRQQNLELAQANSKLSAERNSSIQAQGELQHELGIKNGILKALKLELAEIKNTAKLSYKIDDNEVGTSQNNQSDQMFQADKGADNLCHAKRRRMSKSQSSASAVTKQVKCTGEVDKQRYCLRSKLSALLKAENLVLDETKYDVTYLQENLANEKGAMSLGATVQEETREDTESSGPTITEQFHFKENIKKKRPSLRRQSARFMPENPETPDDAKSTELKAEKTALDEIKYDRNHLQENLADQNRKISLGATVEEKTREDTESSVPATTEQVHFKENIKEKRLSLRRQSARFKPENPEPIDNEKSTGLKAEKAALDESKYDIYHLQVNLAIQNRRTSLGATVEEETTEDTESSGPAATEQVHLKENIKKKRHSLRRQSPRFKPENPEPNQDFFQIDDVKFAISNSCDNNNSVAEKSQEIRRSSVGRPLRQSVEKIVSYKEIPLNVKMRRPG